MGTETLLNVYTNDKRWLFVFGRATEQQIRETLPENWSDKGCYFINLDYSEGSFDSGLKIAEKTWKKIMNKKITVFHRRISLTS